MPEDRRLAAIMFTDIVGYTRLMGSDEENAFKLLTKNREIHTKLIQKYNGNLIKEIGDGMLVSFNLASQAVSCAIDIQKACSSIKIPLKIGIHEGEMVFERNDVFGDGVNIASRIQESAKAGCILVSESVYRDVKNKSNIEATHIREISYKNVDQPVKVYIIGYEGGPELKSYFKDDDSKVKTKKPSINIRRFSISSVLVILAAITIFIIFNSSRSVPFDREDWIIITDFENLTGDTVFNQSLNVALEISLQQSVFVNVFPRVKVGETLKRMGKNSSTTVDEETAIEIARREGIKVIVVCSISRIGGVYSLSSRIVEVNTNETLRSVTFKAEGKDEVLNSLDKLGRKTRKDLGESLGSINYEVIPLPKATTHSLEALKYFVDGFAAWTDAGKSDEARDLFLRAIELDPEFAIAHAYLGSLYYWINDRIKGEEHFTKALNLLDRLTEKEKLSIEARVERFRGNLDGAIIKYGAYLRKYPNSSAEWFSLGYCHMMLHQYEKAIDAFNKSIELVGRNESNTYINMAVCHKSLKNYQQAIDYYLKAFELNPNLLMVNNINHEFGFTYIEIGEFQKAKEVFEKLKEGNDGQKAQALRSLALLSSYRGKMGIAVSLYKESIRIFSTLGYGLSEFRTRLFLANSYNAMGKKSEYDSELTILEKLLLNTQMSPWWYLIFGKHLVRSGKISKAEICLDRISESINEGNRSDEASYHLLAGEIALAQGNFSKAKEHIDTGLDLRSDAYTIESIAYFYHNTGDIDIAIDKYLDIINVENPLGWEAQDYWIQAHYILAKLYEKKGNSDLAIKFYQQLINIWEEADNDLPAFIDTNECLKDLLN